MKQHPLRWFFGLTFAICWGIAVLFVVFRAPLSAVFGNNLTHTLLYYIAVYAPSLSALLVTALISGPARTRKLIGSYARWRVGARWYLGCIAAILACDLLVMFAKHGLNSPTLSSFATHWLGVLTTAPLILLIDPGVIGEELGWRGFALPRLLERFSPLASGVILGVIWGVWHLPGFVISSSDQHGLALGSFFLGTVSLSLLMTWVCVRTSGSVLVGGMLLHFLANHAQSGASSLGVPLLVLVTTLLACNLDFFLTGTQIRQAVGIKGSVGHV
jgi:uncharacterized protein